MRSPPRLASRCSYRSCSPSHGLRPATSSRATPWDRPLDRCLAGVRRRQSLGHATARHDGSSRRPRDPRRGSCVGGGPPARGPWRAAGMSRRPISAITPRCLPRRRRTSRSLSAARTSTRSCGGTLPPSDAPTSIICPICRTASGKRDPLGELTLVAEQPFIPSKVVDYGAFLSKYRDFYLYCTVSADGTCDDQTTWIMAGYSLKAITHSRFDDGRRSDVPRGAQVTIRGVCSKRRSGDLVAEDDSKALSSS